jgi:hypothetical protein
VHVFALATAETVEDDWRLRPEWLSQLNPQVDCGASSLTPQPPPSCSAL